MAGIVDVTVALGGMVTMERETPALPVLQAATAKSLGYITQADISFNATGATPNVYSIDAAGSGFTAAGFDGCDGELILVSSTSGLNDGLYTLVSDTDAKLTVVEPVTVETAVAAGTVVIYGVAVFQLTPTKKSENLLVIYSEGVEAAGELGMIPCAINGDFWAASTPLYTAFTATTVTDSTYYLVMETGKFLKSDGTIQFLLRPLATKQLYSDHRPAVGFLELP